VKHAKRWFTVVNAATLLSVFGLCFAGQLGLAYWWPAMWVVGTAGVGLSFWLAVRYKL
jgi:predicted benzoate:H+ symporter BenE